MKNILLANIGNRNIKYKGEFLDKANFFDETKLLFNNIEKEKSNIEINIIPDVLNNYEIHKLYLFATNQNFCQDTFYEAKIIEYILKDNYYITLIEKKDDPRNRELAFKFFENFFDSNKDLGNNKLYILGSGGVPAMKEALNFYSIINYRTSTIIDVDENKKDKILISNIQKEYLKNIDKHSLIKFIDDYNYNGALSFIKSNSYLKNYKIEQSLKYCLYRFNFDFEHSNNIYKNNIKNIDFLEKIDEKRQEGEMLSELIHNIIISYKKGEYTMLLGKVFRLFEGIEKYFFEQNFGILTENHDDVIKFIESNENILNFCKEFKFGNSVIGLKFNKPSRILFYELNKEYIKDNDEYEKWKNLNGKLNNLSEIRNKSIMAHGRKGIGQNEVKSIVKDLENINKKENIFDVLNGKIKKLINDEFENI